MSSMKVGLEKMAPPPPAGGEREALPCPRCQSSNTKFCYYNNYNFSQPRYFCKSCRRYWTRGGTLRDVPVGGCSRKSAKRSRTSSPATTPSSAATATATTTGAVQSNTVYPVQVGGVGGGGFTSLLALGGFGLGLGMDEVRYGFGGYGLGGAGWSNYGAVCGGGGGGGGDTWQMGGGEGGCSCAECFTTSLPELAISTPGYGLK